MESPRKKTLSSVPCVASWRSISSIEKELPRGPGTALVTVMRTHRAPANGKRCSRVRAVLPVTLTTSSPGAVFAVGRVGRGSDGVGGREAIGRSVREGDVVTGAAAVPLEEKVAIHGLNGKGHARREDRVVPGRGTISAVNNGVKLGVKVRGARFDQRIRTQRPEAC